MQSLAVEMAAVLSLLHTQSMGKGTLKTEICEREYNDRCAHCINFQTSVICLLDTVVKKPSVAGKST